MLANYKLQTTNYSNVLGFFGLVITFVTFEFSSEFISESSDRELEPVVRASRVPVYACRRPEVDRELTLSKSILEDVCDREIDVLAYPNGMVNPAVAAAASRAGYKYLLETGDTANSISQTPMPAFSRINMYQRTTEESLAQLFGIYQAIRRLREALR